MTDVRGLYASGIAGVKAPAFIERPEGCAL